MEDLLNLQLAQRDIMEKFIINARKTAKEKRTKTFYVNRLANFKELWNTFQEAHKTIVAEEYKMKATPNHPYFQQDIYSEVEDFYYINYEKIKEQFEESFPSQQNNQQSQSEINAENSISQFTTHNSDYGIKLPSINLDKFNGDYKKWPTFHDLFGTLVHQNHALSKVQKLQYLKLYLSGEPENLLRHYQITDNNYDAAWELLKERYDNKRVLINAQLKVLLSQNNIAIEASQSIKTLLDTTSECLQALENLKISTKEWDPLIVYLMVQRLPHESHQLWEQDISKSKEFPTWNKLKEFLEARFRTLEAVASKRVNGSKWSPPNLNKNKHTSQAFYVASGFSCSLCNGQHSIRQCDNFAKLNVAKRYEIVKRKNLCLNCLSSNHQLNKCTSNKTCLTCRKKHHSLLHRIENAKTSNFNNNQNKTSANNYVNQNNSTPTTNSTTTNHILKASSDVFTPQNSSSTNSFTINHSEIRQNSEILLATALIQIIAPSGRKVIVKALIDQGSQMSFVSENIVQALRLKKEAIQATIQGIGKNQVHNVNARVHFQIKSPTSEASIQIKALVLKKLTNQLPTQQIKPQDWNHINNLKLADPNYYKPGPIDLLIGADFFSHIILQGIKKGVTGTPLAQNTIFGWILSGHVQHNQSQQIVVNNFHISAELNNQLKAFWEMEEVKTISKYNEEETLCEEKYKSTVNRLSTGKYEVELPLRTNSNGYYLGKSRDKAVKRLLQLEARFKRNPTLKTEYSKCINEYINLGHMIPVQDNEENHAETIDSITRYNCSYLPHHAIIKESSSTTKLRVVFDASSTTTSGISLNEMLLKGPTIQDDLAEILLRWRKYRIAFSADIEKMYRQIWVKSNYAELQRIVWREATNQPIQHFKLKTVTFGTKSAPYLATRTIKQLATDEEQKFPRASKIAKNDFYVDDLLSGADTVKDAINIKLEMNNLMETGGFPLRKWSSNCKEVAEKSNNQNEIKLPFENEKEEEIIRALGIRWNTEKDTCNYFVNLEQNETKWTKRKILSHIARLFDPLGWLGPIIISGKILMQKLWLCNSDWDQEVSIEIENEWKKYFNNLADVRHISIQRWLQYSKNDKIVEIHGFADASTKAYAGVVYLCTTNEFGIRSVSLITAKTKVAPIKTVSLPRLELCAVTLVTKLIQYTLNALQISEVEIYGWTDSEIVLAWLKDHPTRWTTFVANRVSHVHEILKQNVWAHVSTKENPADCASRGMYAYQLKDHKLWWQGPEWLKQSKNNWPSKSIPNTTIEMKKCKLVHYSNIEQNFENRFSSFTKLVRVVAYCLRFAFNSRKNNTRQTGYLKITEIQNALKILIKRSQLRHFSEEIQLLQVQKEVKPKSRISKLYPFLDSDNTLRVTGRLQQSHLTFNKKHPIILPDKDHFVNLLIQKIHRETLHGGFQLMVTIMKDKYWLINARNSIRHEIHKCVRCFRYKQNVSNQLMGNLPAARVQVNRPFSHTGVDYCGPFELKTYKGKSSKRYKSYIAVYICMATKAMHLELVTDLTAEGFIASFRRFCARRGMCSHIYCDNGTNFVGANKILTRAQKLMTGQIDNEIAEAIENLGVKFHFNPPASPHFGGLWEAGVRSVKHHLKRVMHNSLLTYEEFTTTLHQIEACLNSRPLCEITHDPQDLNALTPAHFLIGDTLMTPPETIYLDENVNRLTRWQHLQQLTQSFWKRWNSEYLSRLQQRPKWIKANKNINIGDLVLLKEENLPPSRWLLARITDIHPGPEGLIRVVTLRIKDSKNYIKRPITKICILPNNEQPTSYVNQQK